jgi:N6-adenosine-specific RNA methylase IME4/ParB-like chromosome segregation protein Spo0J
MQRTSPSSPVTSLPVDSIRVSRRRRRAFGDLGALARSIADIGLLHPLAVTPDFRLVAGERRLRAVRDILGWESVPVHVVHGLDDALRLLQAERDENTQRLPFTPTEAVALGRQLERLELAAARQRQREGGRRGGMAAGRSRPKDSNGTADKVRKTFPKPIAKGRVRDRVGEALGMSGLTYQRAKAVVEAAEADPQKYGRLRDTMDRTGRVDGVYRRLRVLRDAETLESAPPPLPDGPFSVLVADPPWAYEHRNGDLSKRGQTPYATMSAAKIKALPVARLAAEDAVLWLWTTNAHLPLALEVAAAWGFTYKTCLTWAKQCAGTGDWLRGQTEHCLLCIRGRPTVKPDRSTLLVAGPGRRRHSVKPEAFYELVEAICPGAKVELFARRRRPGWTAWGGPELAGQAAKANGHAGRLGRHSSAKTRSSSASS